jgi:hypothetical protein
LLPALLVPPPGLLFDSVLSVVPGPLWSGTFVTAPGAVVLLPLLELCSRRQRDFAEPVSVSQLVTVEPVVALPVAEPLALPGPDLAAAASRGVSWPLALLPPAAPPACPKDAVEMPSSAVATAAPSNFMFIRFS